MIISGRPAMVQDVVLQDNAAPQGAAAVLSGFQSNANIEGVLNVVSGSVASDSIVYLNSASSSRVVLGPTASIVASFFTSLTVTANVSGAGNLDVEKSAFLNLAGAAEVNLNGDGAAPSKITGNSVLLLENARLGGKLEITAPTRVVGSSRIQNIDAPGMIRATNLTVAETGCIDMRGIGQGVPCMDAGGAPAGTFTVDGKLVVQDQGRVQNTSVVVPQVAVAADAPVRNNNITRIDPIFAGGEFFVTGHTGIYGNVITAEGDRFLDLERNPLLSQPAIAGNLASVNVRTWPASPLGTFLELRGYDFDCGGPTNPECGSGAFPAAGSAGFTADPSANWVLERLELFGSERCDDPAQPCPANCKFGCGAKVNLANVQGFEFNAHTVPAGYTVSDALYVKHLVLHPNAVLNTGLQTLYYQSLEDENGNTLDPLNLGRVRKIVDVPLLGYPDDTIGMNDATASPFNEFDIRVRRRLRDAGDQQPANLPPLEGSIQQLADVLAPGDGVMEMRTQGAGRQPAGSVAAKGSFARNSGGELPVTFAYLFLDNPDAQIVVYLSDRPEMGEHSVEVARVKMPPAGQPGSIGSNQFGVFSALFPPSMAKSLRYVRGNYVELALVASRDTGNHPLPSRVWVDNWSVRRPKGRAGQLH